VSVAVWKLAFWDQLVQYVGALAASVGVCSWCHFGFVLNFSVVHAAKMDDKERYTLEENEV